MKRLRSYGLVTPLRLLPITRPAIAPRHHGPAQTSAPAGWGDATGHGASQVHCRRVMRKEYKMADKPSRGLADVVAASTAVSDIDGRAGLLFYRGYDIHQLAGSATFEETAFLLQRGRAPSAA